jgi:hypothetical protein
LACALLRRIIYIEHFHSRSISHEKQQNIEKICQKPYNSTLYKVSRGIVWFSFILYGENKLYMDSYVIFLKYLDAHTFPPCRKVYKNELHQKIFQKFPLHGAQRDTDEQTYVTTLSYKRFFKNFVQDFRSKHEVLYTSQKIFRIRIF